MRMTWIRIESKLGVVEKWSYSVCVLKTGPTKFIARWVVAK